VPRWPAGSEVEGHAVLDRATFAKTRKQVAITSMKVLAFVLGSAWFFPVSCSSTLFAGIHVISHIDTREVARGEAVHPHFWVVTEPGENGQRFRTVTLTSLRWIREKGVDCGFWFLMPKSFDAIDFGRSTHVSYRVLDSQSSAQEIEVEYKDGDGTYWSRYRATRDEVTPLTSRRISFDYMFGALPFAVGVGCGTRVVGRYLRRRLREKPSKESELAPS